MRKILLVLLLIIIPAMGYSKNIFLKSYMKHNRLNATVVIEDLKGKKRYIYNKKRANDRFYPASTFKVVNTLIALQEHVIKDEKEVIKWDGTDKGVASWNKDQCLETALPDSCIWFYQALARHISNDIYVKYLELMHYGNMKTGSNIESFWIDGDLKISAIEQIKILKNIYTKKYPFDKKNYEILKNLMVVEKNDNYTLYAKTGWGANTKPAIGSYIGFVETKNKVWFFSCNLNINKHSQGKYRKQIIDQAFRELKIFK